MRKAICLFVLFITFGASSSNAQSRIDELLLTNPKTISEQSDIPFAASTAADEQLLAAAPPIMSDDKREVPANVNYSDWRQSQDHTSTDGSGSVDKSNLESQQAQPTQPTNAAANKRSEASIYVQISAKRSETEAQSALISLQTTFPNILGNQQSIIRRADLGSKGIYYRAQIGPYSAQQADQLCSNLKAAGGECFLQN